MEVAEQLNQIAREMGELHGDYYGHGPSTVTAQMTEDIVVVLLEETFNRAERTLIERGEADEVRRTRRRFQEVVAQDFIAIVEQATGRTVRSFVSDTDLDERIAIETFVLGDARQDMGIFE